MEGVYLLNEIVLDNEKSVKWHPNFNRGHQKDVNEYVDTPRGKTIL